VNLYPYIPPAFALFLLLIATFQDGYITSNIDDEKTQNIALDAIARLEFFNGWFAALITVFVIYSTSKAFGLMTGTALVLVVLFVPMMFIVLARKPGDVHGQRAAKKVNLRLSTAIRIFLIIVNIILIGAIYADQHAGTILPNPQKPANTQT